MTETTFAEIQDLTHEKLDRNYQNPPVNPSHKMVAGFRVRDTDKDREQIATGRQQIDRLRTGDSTIRSKLAQQNVTPLAVIPTEIWNRICQNAGLRQLSPNSDGQVPVSTKDAKAFIKAGNLASMAFWFGPWLAFIAWGVSLDWNSRASRVEWFAYAAGWGMIVSGSMLIRLFSNQTIFVLVHKALTLGLSRIYDILPRQVVLDRLLDVPFQYSYDRMAMLRLPTPPDEVVEIIERTEKLYRVKLAIAPGGYGLQERPSEIIKPALVKYVKARKVQWQEFRDGLDPIIYVEDSGMTAIVAQFGPFAIEREAVEAALAAEDQI